jgi:hypothetical protein
MKGDKMSKKTICYLILGLSIFIFSAGAIHILAAIKPSMCEREPEVASCNDYFIGACREGGGCSWNRGFTAMDCKITCRNYYFDDSGNCVNEAFPEVVTCGEMAN